MTEQAAAPRAIDKVRGAFGQRLWHVDVPEWDLTIYFKALTTADMIAAGQTASDTSLSVYERNVRMLIHKALDADGKPMFTAGDMHYLMTEARFDVLSRVTEFMWTCGALADARDNVPGEAEQIARDPNGAGPSSTSFSPAAAG